MTALETAGRAVLTELRDRHGITIVSYVALTDICNGLPSWDVMHHTEWVMTFFVEADAEVFADEMAIECAVEAAL